jgi:hypothetical protein
MFTKPPGSDVSGRCVKSVPAVNSLERQEVVQLPLSVTSLLGHLTNVRGQQEQTAQGHDK